MEELAGRQVWLPVKMKIRPSPEEFTPCPVIYKPSRRGIHHNVIHKITRSEGKCYEFAFIRSFSRFDAHKYVCSACRVLKMQNPQLFHNHRLPYVRVSQDCFQTNPEWPPNANHFCKPKMVVDVIHAGEMSMLKQCALETPEIDVVGEEYVEIELAPAPEVHLEEASSEEVAAHHAAVAESIFDEHNYASTSGRSRAWDSKNANYSNNASLNKFPQFSNDPVVRVPSNGTSKIIYVLPYAKENCYEFFERKSRSVYFDVYACAGCNKMKENLGSTVGPVPTVHVRGDHYMTDPMRPRHRHYCIPKMTNELVVQGEMCRLMKNKTQAAAITSFEELIKAVRTSLMTADDGTDEFPLLNDYLNELAQDRKRAAVVEKRYGFKRPEVDEDPPDCEKIDCSVSSGVALPGAAVVLKRSAKKKKGDEGPLSLSQKEAREKKEREKMEAAAKRMDYLGDDAPFPDETAEDPVLIAQQQPPPIAPPEDGAKPPPVNAPCSVAFGLQKRVVVSKLAPSPASSSELKRRPGSIPVLFPVKVLRMEETQPPQLPPMTSKEEEQTPPSLPHKDDDYVDVEGC